MIHIVNAIIVLTFLAIPTIAQENPLVDINISGKVTDKDGKTIFQAAVSLEKSKLSATTDVNGTFSLVQEASVGISNNSSLAPSTLNASINNRRLSIQVPKQAAVTITAYSIHGKVLLKRIENLNTGTHQLSVPPAKVGIYLFKIQSGNNDIVLKNFTIDNRWQGATSENQPLSSPPVLAKQTLVTTAFADVLKVAKSGYQVYSMNIDNATKSGLTIKLNINDTPPVKGNKLIGWASVSDCGPSGTTGGGDATPVTVTDATELKELMKGSDPRVIILSGRVKSTGNFSGAKNKTLIGINNAEIYGGTGLVVCKNVIIRNIKFTDGSNDSFGLSGSTCISLENCEFVDGADGNCDIVNGTDFATVSYCKFYYTKSHTHMLACLVGNTQPNTSDVGKLRVTFHHNLFGAGINSRAPRVRYGQVHVFNNYYKFETVSGGGSPNYSIGGGFESKLVVENNYFENVGKAFTYMADENTAQVVAKGNVGGSVPNRGSAFKPPYEYTLETAEAARDIVKEKAGVK